MVMQMLSLCFGSGSEDVDCVGHFECLCEVDASAMALSMFVLLCPCSLHSVHHVVFQFLEVLYTDVYIIWALPVSQSVTDNLDQTWQVHCNGYFFDTRVQLHVASLAQATGFLHLTELLLKFLLMPNPSTQGWQDVALPDKQQVHASSMMQLSNEIQ